MRTADLHRARETERELQRVFDAWPFEQATYQRIRTTDREYIVVGCPKWDPGKRRSIVRLLENKPGKPSRFARPDTDERPGIVAHIDDRGLGGGVHGQRELPTALRRL